MHTRLLMPGLLVAALIVSLLSGFVSTALAIDLDYERENRWAEQVLPSILVGDPLWIEQPNGVLRVGSRRVISKHSICPRRRAVLDSNLQNMFVRRDKQVAPQ